MWNSLATHQCTNETCLSSSHSKNSANSSTVIHVPRQACIAECAIYSLDGAWLLLSFWSKNILPETFIIRCKTCSLDYVLMSETDNFHVFYDFHWAIMPKCKSNDSLL